MPDIQPLPPEPDYQQPPAGFPAATEKTANDAADLIRSKLDRIYAMEPDAKTELAEAEAVPHRSSHQQFMHELSNSGKDLATIQTDWHNYYIGLDDTAKHQVWQEFYSNSVNPAVQSLSTDTDSTEKPAASQDPHIIAAHKHEAKSVSQYKSKRTRANRRDLRSPQAIRAAVRDQVTAGGKLTMKHHIQSLLFGLGAGVLVLFVVLFGFFNDTIIAPFIQPSRVASATPIIVDSSNVPASPNPQVIIPKINVQIPVDYSQTTTDEATIETALENGIVHYPTTVKPGEQGNAAFFGHSSNNIFNKGKYKFAFVLLHRMEVGDTFYLSNNNKMYIYKIITKKVVDPSQIEVLDAVPGQVATATLITCDPPGTSLKRLVVVGQQISPDPAGNTASVAQPVTNSASVNLPGNGPTLGGRLARSAIGKTVGTILILGTVIVVFRWVNKPSR